MKFTSIICILTLGIFELVLSQIQSCQNAVTKKDGSCVNIEACKNIYAVRNDARYAPYIIKIKCRTHLQTDGVCCDVAEVDKAKIPASPVPVTASAVTVDVTRHPNFRLLDIEECGNNNQDRISNGNLTQVFEYPWMALLRYKDEYSGTTGFYCGGTLITDRYVLTAAHCLTSRVNKLFEVRLGEHDLDKSVDCKIVGGEEDCAPPVQDIAVEKVIPHPMYNKPKTRMNDIALIRLAKEADLSKEGVVTICLPVTPKLQKLVPKKLVVTGWGQTEMGTQSSVLLQAIIPSVADSTCEQDLGIKLDFGQFCAGGENKVDNCQGDSGGPLAFAAQLNTAQYVQFGIVSFGQRYCGALNKPGVYTKVGDYMKWIMDTIEP